MRGRVVLRGVRVLLVPKALPVQIALSPVLKVYRGFRGLRGVLVGLDRRD
jgi:hypothetical protein